MFRGVNYDMNLCTGLLLEEKQGLVKKRAKIFKHSDRYMLLFHRLENHDFIQNLIFQKFSETF